MLKSELNYNSEDVHLSYLPLAHIMERLAMLTCIGVGALVYFSCGNIMRLKEDLARVRPTVLCVVPRILNKYNEAFKTLINSLPENHK